MFTIMENRKRPRMEMINTNNNNSNENLQGVASTTTPALGTATLATIGGQSFILSNSSHSLPTNILLSICDDNSDESEEYIIDNSMLTSIKQEQNVGTQTSFNHTQQQQQPTLVTTVPQYRIVNQASKTLNTINSPSTANSSPVTNNSSLITTNSVHLPPGCEIYVIKECIDSPKNVIAEPSTTNINSSPKTTTIKLEPMSPLPLLRHSSPSNNCNTQTLNSTSTITINTTSPVISSTSNTTSTSSTSTEDTAKRSLILEAYKKRDDKRRATHNEVERRRRDKINSWIFKLKEMLPSEVTPCNVSSTSLNKDNITLANSTNINQNLATNRLLAHQPGSVTTTTRTPPSDSKSQILIKACEYIKSMQEEINSLRECLTENENLRLSNQRLQDEINNLRTKQQQKLHNNNHILLKSTNHTANSNNSNNYNHNNADTDDCEITLNSLNTTYANVQLFGPTTIQNNNHQHLADLVGLTTNSNNATTPTSVNVTYAKRELIITDYVD